MLEIHLFGTPTITLDGQPLKIQRRVTRALLYFLAANRQPIGRARLAALFWPDLSDEASRARLRDHLGKLRRDLPNASLVKATPQDISLDFDKVSVDALLFQDLYVQIGQITWTLPPSSTIPFAIYNKLVELVNLWKSPGFIEGVDLFVSEEAEEWLFFTRQKFVGHLGNVMQRLYHHERASGNLQLAIQWLQKALEHNPLNEEVNLLLAQTYLENGQRAEARKQFDNMQKVLEYEPDSQLSEEAKAVKELIYGQVQDISLEEEHEWPVRHSFNIPYVGQEQVFGQIESTYKRGGGVNVYGEAGAGKTRLIQEAYNRIHPHPKLLMAACYEHKTAVPLHPWIELLRNNLTKDIFLKLSSFEASLLCVIIPERASWRQDLQSVPDVVTPRVHENMFDAIYKAIQLISDKTPLMLFLDDMQWADESSSEFLISLLNRSLFRQSNHIFLMATRIEGSNTGISKYLQLHPSKQIEDAYLDRLNTAQVTSLVKQALGRTPSPEFIEQLTKATGGNPYFVLETIQEILDLPVDISLQEPSSLPISKSVYRMIRERLRRLSSDAREVIEMAAILGNHFDVVVTEQAIAFQPNRFVRAMESLRENHLITEVREGENYEYAFLHENIRESLLQDLIPIRAKLLHHNAARALANAAHGQTQEIAVLLAHHHEKAEEFSQAFDYWVQSASHAYQLTSIKDALIAFRHAKYLISIDKNLEDKQLYELYTKWAGVAFNMDDSIEVERLYHELLILGQERKSDLLIGVSFDGFSDACFVKNQFESGLEFSSQSISHLERAGNTYALLTAKLHWGVFLYMLGKLSEAREIFYKLLEKISDVEGEKYIFLNNSLHYQIGIVEILMGYPIRGLEFLEQAIAHKQKSPAPSEIIQIYVAMGLGYYLTGEYKAGCEISAKAIAIGERMGTMRMLGYAYAYNALNCHYFGLLDQAWEHAEKALEIGQKHGHGEISALAYRTMGNIYLRLEDYQTAIEYFQQGVQVAGEHFVALELMTLLGHALAAAGQVETGLEYLTRAYQQSSQLQLGSISVYARGILLITNNRHKGPNTILLEEIEFALVDAKVRSIARAATVLSTPFLRVSQRPNDYLKQMGETLNAITRMTDPLFEAQVLHILIKFKQQENLSYQGEASRLAKIFEEFSPRVKSMPFEKAWQNYFDSLHAITKD